MENSKETIGRNKENPYQDSDYLLKARVARSDIQLLAKYVEGMGHLGVVTTLDRFRGDVLIQTTRDCWPELRKLLLALDLELELQE